MARWHDGDRVDLVDEMSTLTTNVQRQHAPAVLASQLQLPTARGCSAAAAAGGAHLLLEDPGAATVV